MINTFSVRQRIISPMDTFNGKDSTALSALYTFIIFAAGAAGLFIWRAALGHDGGIVRLLRHFF